MNPTNNRCILCVIQEAIGTRHCIFWKVYGQTIFRIIPWVLRLTYNRIQLNLEFIMKGQRAMLWQLDILVGFLCMSLQISSSDIRFIMIGLPSKLARIIEFYSHGCGLCFWYRGFHEGSYLFIVLKIYDRLESDISHKSPFHATSICCQIITFTTFGATLWSIYYHWTQFMNPT